MLIQKQFARRGEQPTEVDYLLGVDDRLRLGALRFERFDRAYGEDGSEARIPYMSATTLLNRTDGDRASMVEIAEELRLLSINGDSAAELFSRTAINLLVGNTDNHLRNHGFIRVDGAWRLSPVFDITPATTKTNFATSVDVVGDDSVDTLMGAAGWFGLNDNQAIERLSRAVDAVKQWKELARRNQIAVAEDKQVAPSFDGGHLQRAQVLIREHRA